MFSFEVRRNQKTPNGLKLNVPQNGYLGFVIFLDFDPQNSKCQFLKFIVYQTRNFQVILKTKIYVIEMRTNNAHTKFRRNILVFGCPMAQKKR